MPTYDYICEKCNHSFEYFQSMSDSHLKECPECKGKVRRLVSGGSGLIFKGSGFYLTDMLKSLNLKIKNSLLKLVKKKVKNHEHCFKW